MKFTKVALLAAIVVLVSGLFSPPVQAGVSFSAFYSNLSPYGSWQVSAQYGRVWQPAVYYAGWNPYYDGHWVYSDFGWTWVSDYEWGAIPYHYGTWVSDPYYGWVWVPGYTWAPSWVVFRTGPDYIGWAPVSPGFSVGVSFGFGVPTASPFVFVSAGNFLAPRIGTCFIPHSRTTVIINNTRIVNNLVVENNVVVNRGLNPRSIERASGRRVREVPIERVSRAMPGGPRVSRAALRVDPRRTRHGLRAAEPVSANQPLPDVRRGRGDTDRYLGGNQASSERSSQDSPRAPRRDSGDTETRRAATLSAHDRVIQGSPRTPQRATGDIERQRERTRPTMRQSSPQSAYRPYAKEQDQARRPTSSNTMRPGNASPGETRSIQPPNRQLRPDRQPNQSVRSSNRQPAPSRANPPSQRKPGSQKRDKHTHGSAGQ